MITCWFRKWFKIFDSRKIINVSITGFCECMSLFQSTFIFLSGQVPLWRTHFIVPKNLTFMIPLVFKKFRIVILRNLVANSVNFDQKSFARHDYGKYVTRAWCPQQEKRTKVDKKAEERSKQKIVNIYGRKYSMHKIMNPNCLAIAGPTFYCNHQSRGWITNLPNCCDKALTTRFSPFCVLLIVLIITYWEINSWPHFEIYLIK